MTMPDYDPTQPIARQADCSAGRLLHSDCPMVIRGSHSYESPMAEQRESPFDHAFVRRSSEPHHPSDDRERLEQRGERPKDDDIWIRSELVDGDAPCLRHMEATPIRVIVIAIEEDDHARKLCA